MRIAQISAHTSPLAALGGRNAGGMNIYVLELSRELARMGHEVDILTRREGNDPPFIQLEPGLRLVHLDAGPAEPLPKEEIAANIPKFARALHTLIKDEGRGYDIIHSHYWQSGRAGLAVARALDIPHAVMFHTLGEVKNRARISEFEPRERIFHERRIARSSQAIVTASPHERDLLARYYGADRERMHTVPCGIDVDLFAPTERAESRARLGLDPESPILIWVGRLERLKGVDILIRALAMLRRTDVTLLLVGGDEHAAELRAELEALARDEGIAERVRFTGAVPHDDLPLYYSAADVCVVPSYYESFGLVAVEAMATGTPVVASAVGGLTSTVTDGVDGYLIPWRCPEPFAEKIEVLIENVELRHNFGRAARRSAQRFRWSEVARGIAAIYEAVAREAGRPANEGIPQAATDATMRPRTAG